MGVPFGRRQGGSKGRVFDGGLREVTTRGLVDDEAWPRGGCTGAPLCSKTKCCWHMRTASPWVCGVVRAAKSLDVARRPSHARRATALKTRSPKKRRFSQAPAEGPLAQAPEEDKMAADIAPTDELGRALAVCPSLGPCWCAWCQVELACETWSSRLASGRCMACIAPFRQPCGHCGPEPRYGGAWFRSCCGS